MRSEQHEDAIARVQALLSERKYPPDQIAETALHALYPQLSEGAVNTFHSLGRGAILMDLRDLVEGKLNTSYVPQAMLLRLQEAADLFDDALTAVDSYDPEREFVTIVWQSDLLVTFKLPLL